MVANDGRMTGISARHARLGAAIKATDSRCHLAVRDGTEDGVPRLRCFPRCFGWARHRVPLPRVNPYIVIGKPGDACVEWEAAPTKSGTVILLLSSDLAAPPGR